MGALGGKIPGNVRDEYIKKVGGKTPCIWTFDANSNNQRYYPFSQTFADMFKEDSVLSKENFSKFLEDIPRVQIRAYMPETLLGEIFGLFQSFVQGIKAGSEAANSSGDLWSSVKMQFNDLANGIDNFISIIKTNPESLFNALIKGLNDLHLADHDNAILNLPNFLYYRILGSRTNNIYEFPAYVQNGFFDADGSYGFADGAGSIMGSNFIGNQHGQFLSMIASSFGTTIMPMFNPKNGGGQNPQVQVKLNLINDTAQHAIQNFSFVQSLMLNNLWVQYGLCQGPASLYDLKICGGNRFLMCTGDFKVNYNGVLRKPNFQIENNPWGEQFRIPDSYTIDMTFKSLLPNNFNNYMIGIAKTNEHSLFKVGPGETEDSGITTFAENVKDVWKLLSESEATKDAIRDGLIGSHGTTEQIKETISKATEVGMKAGIDCLKETGDAQKASKVAKDTANEIIIDSNIENHRKNTQKILKENSGDKRAAARAVLERHGTDNDTGITIYEFDTEDSLVERFTIEEAEWSQKQ